MRDHSRITSLTCLFKCLHNIKTKHLTTGCSNEINQVLSIYNKTVQVLYGTIWNEEIVTNALNIRAKLKLTELYGCHLFQP